MAHLIGYRVADTTVTTGTKATPYALDENAPDGFFPFDDQFVNNDTTFYFCENFSGTTGDLEVGKGTYKTGTPNTLERTTIIYASNGDLVNGINWTTGTKNIVSGYSGELMDGNNNLSEIASASAARTNLGLGSIAIEAVDALPAITVTGTSITVNPTGAGAVCDLGDQGSAQNASVRFFTAGTGAAQQGRLRGTGGTTSADTGTLQVYFALVQLASQANEVVKMAEGSGASVEVHGEMNCDVGSGRLVVPVGADLWAT